jgi:predicted outer membrane repeat protein
VAVRLVWWCLALAACDGGNDADPSTLTFDEDGDHDNDGFISEAEGGPDCDDADPHIKPGGGERCDGRDEDCDGQIDENAEDAIPGFVDADQDGFGDPELPTSACDTVPADMSENNDDCDDADAGRRPGLQDICNGKDDDCDTTTLETASIGATAYGSIAEAVLASADGTVISICDGTHREPPITIDRSVTLRGASGDRTAATIEGGGNGALLLVVSGKSLTIESLTLTGGRGTSSDLPILEAGTGTAGGAINALDGGKAITVRDCVLEGNSAEVGGAIAGSDITIEHSELIGNASTAEVQALAGAVYVAEDGLLTVTDSLFQGNHAQYGGAIGSLGTTVLTGVTAIGNDAEFDGGVGYLLNAVPFDLGVVPATLSITTSTFTDNTAVFGGVWFVDGATATADDATVFDGNHGTTSGGALYLFCQEFGTSWIGGTFIGNTSANGGAAYVDAIDDLTTGADLGSCALSGIHALDNDATVSGGAVVLDNDPVTFTNSDITSSSSPDGGGVWVTTADATTTIEDVDLVACTGARGGGVRLQGSSVVLRNTLLENNNADSGGGVYVDAGSALTIDGSTFIANMPEDVWVNGAGYGGLGAEVLLTCVGASQSCF